MATLHRPDVAVVDYYIGSHLGTEIINQLPASTRPAVLYLSGKPLEDVLVKSDGEGFIQKPVSLGLVDKA